MPKSLKLKLPRYVHGYVDRHGRPRFYYRRAGQKALALPGLPWSPDFMAAYATAMNHAPQIEIGASRSRPGSIAQLVAAYLGSTAWQELAQGTRVLRKCILDRFREVHGEAPIKGLDQANMKRLLGKLSPNARRNWRTTLRGLFVYGVEHSLCPIDPTEGIVAKKAKSDGYRTWSEDDIARFEARWPSGSPERLAFALMLYTGAAVGDAIGIGRQHIRNGRLTYARKKTGNAINGVPILPALQRELDQVRDRMTFLVGARGVPFTTPAGLIQMMRVALKKAGLEGLSSHGLRKACARRLAEHGCSVNEIMAVLGHKDPRMAIYYAKEAEKTRLAGSAMARLGARES